MANQAVRLMGSLRQRCGGAGARASGVLYPLAPRAGQQTIVGVQFRPAQQFPRDDLGLDLGRVLDLKGLPW